MVRLAWIVPVVGVGICVFAPAGRAGNDEGIPLGDEAALVANTVAATVSDGSSLVYNPAGLAAATRDQIDVSGTATLIRFYRVPSLIATTDGSRAEGNFTELVAVPSAVSYVRALGPNLKLGIGLFVPERSSNTIDVGLVEASGTFHLTTTISESLYYGSAGLAWHLGPKLRIGASLSALYYSAIASATAWAGYPGKADGLAQLYSVSALGAALSAGVQWEPTSHLRVGLAIRAPTLLFATAQTGSDIRLDATTVPPAADLHTADLGDSEVGVHQIRPLRARLGVAWVWDASSVSIEGELQTALTEESIGVRRNVTWNIRAGGLLAIAPQTWLGAGAFTDLSPDEAPQALLSRRLDFYGATVGVRLDHPHALAAPEPAPSLVFSTTIALRYAYGTGEVGGILFSAEPQSDDFGVNRAASASVHELGIHLGSTVYF